MALTEGQLLDAIHVEPAQQERVYLIKRGVEAWLEKYCPDAPDEVSDVALMLVVAYIMNQPDASSGRQAFSHALEFSGAGAMLAPWRDPKAERVLNINEREDDS